MRRACWTFAALALVATAGCGLTDLDPGEDPVAYQGSFESYDLDRLVDGQVGMISHFGRTELSFGISGLDPDRDYEWLLRREACEGDGAAIEGPSAYPDFVTDEFGDGEGGTILSRMLGAPSYALEVFDREPGSSTVVACATLTPFDPDAGSG